MSARFPFLKDLGERAGKTFVQGALATVSLETISVVQGNPLDLNLWGGVGVTALGGGIAAVLSLLTSLASKAKTGTASASVDVAESTPAYDPKHDRES